MSNLLSASDKEAATLALRQIVSGSSHLSTAHHSIYSGIQNHSRPHSPDPSLKPVRSALKHSSSYSSQRDVDSVISAPASVLPSRIEGKRHPASPINSRPGSPAQTRDGKEPEVILPDADAPVTDNASVKSMPPMGDGADLVGAATSSTQTASLQQQQQDSGASSSSAPQSTSLSKALSASDNRTDDESLLVGDIKPSSMLPSTSSMSTDSETRTRHSHHHHFWHLGHHHHEKEPKRSPHPASILSANPSGSDSPQSLSRNSRVTSSSQLSALSNELAALDVDHPGHQSDPVTRGASPAPVNVAPKAGWERKVGFDTMPDAMETESQNFSFTLQARTKGFVRTKNTRTFMVAVDNNAYSERALEWMVENLVEDGDEVVALRVLEGEADEIDQVEAREEANELIAQIVEANEEVADRRISIVVEFIAGRPTSTILRVITMYRPDSLIVGTRGKSANALQKMLMLGAAASMGHVSRDVLSHSPVPVVVVRPEAKVQKHLNKRKNDPARRGYHELVGKSTLEDLPMSVSKSKRESLHLVKGRPSASASPRVGPTSHSKSDSASWKSRKSSESERASEGSTGFVPPRAPTPGPTSASSASNSSGAREIDDVQEEEDLDVAPKQKMELHPPGGEMMRVDEHGNCFGVDGHALPQRELGSLQTSPR